MRKRIIYQMLDTISVIINTCNILSITYNEARSYNICWEGERKGERERGERESINHTSKSISKGFFLWVFARNRNRSLPAPSMNLAGRHPRTLISSSLIFLSPKVLCILQSPCLFQIDSSLPCRGNSSFHRNRSLYSLTRAISLAKKFSSYD